MLDADRILQEPPPFLITLAMDWKEVQFDIIPHWYLNERSCVFYVFTEGTSLGTLVSTGINEWDWISSAGPKWLAQLVGDGIDWHYI